VILPVNRRVDPRPGRVTTEQLFDRIIGMLSDRRFNGASRSSRTTSRCSIPASGTAYPQALPGA
jgi:hypothetical protein